jgi:hypothetical protein
VTSQLTNQCSSHTICSFFDLVYEVVGDLIYGSPPHPVRIGTPGIESNAAYQSSSLKLPGRRQAVFIFLTQFTVKVIKVISANSQEIKGMDGICSNKGAHPPAC